MIIPKNQLKSWTALKEQGDLTKLEEISQGITGKKTKTSRQTFARAFEKGKCNDKVYDVMKKFYSDKQKQYAA